MKSSYSNSQGNCVDVTREIVAGDTEVFVVVDSKDPDGDVLNFNRAEWDAFIAGAKNGEFDFPIGNS